MDRPTEPIDSGQDTKRSSDNRCGISTSFKNHDNVSIKKFLMPNLLTFNKT